MVIFLDMRSAYTHILKLKTFADAIISKGDPELKCAIKVIVR